MAQTFYDVLKVPESASTDEIEAAYRERLKETHPDVNDAEDADETVKAVIEARDVLTDPEERALYDRIGHDAYVASPGVSTAGRPTGESATAGEPATDQAGASERSASDEAGVGDAAASADAGTASGVGDAPTGGTRARANGAGTHRSTVAGGGQQHPSGYAVRQSPTPNAREWGRLVPDRESAVLLLAAFICYPPLVISSVYPPFPFSVNVVVGLSTIVIVVYLVSFPEVGVPAFGFWSLVGTGAVIAWPPEPVVAVVALTATWLPFGLSVAVFWLVRP